MKRIFLVLALLVCAQSRAQNESLDSLWKVYDNDHQADTNRLKAVHAILRNYLYSNPDTAIVLAKEELQLAQRTKQKIYEAKALNAIGVALANKKDFLKALEFYTKALAMREEIDDRAGVLQTCNNIANVYATQGNSYKQLELWSGQLNKLKNLNKKQPKYNSEIAECLIKIGWIYNDQGEKMQALEKFQSALSIFTKMKDTGLSIRVTQDLAILYGELRNMTKSRENFKKALVFYEAKKDIRSIRSLYNEMGIAYNLNNDYTNSLVYYAKSLSISDSLSNANNIPVEEKMAHKTWVRGSTGNIAGIYLRQGDIDKALDYSYRGLKAVEETGDSLQVAWALSRLSEVYQKQKDYKKTKYYCDRALSILKRESRFMSAVCGLELRASEIDSATGNGDGAYEHYKQYVILRDKLNSKEIAEAATKEKYQDEYDKQKIIDQVEQSKRDIVVNDEIKRQKIVRNSLICGFLLVLVLVVIVFRGYRYKQKSNKELALKNIEIEEKNKEVMDSIRYASRIQRALITSEKYIEMQLNRLMKNN